MRLSVIALGTLVVLAGLVAPTIAHVIEDSAPTASAARRVCVYGQDSYCIIRIYCVMEPCPHFP
jgi:hypothetical protein